MVASPLDRTQQTATIIDQHLGISFATDDRLKEWDCGAWSGEMWDDLSEKWPQEFSNWHADQFYCRAPGGENYPDMIERATPFLEELLGTDYTTVAIVSHGMIGRVMIGTLLSMSPDQMLSFNQTNETVFRLGIGDKKVSVEHYVSGKGPFPDFSV